MATLKNISTTTLAFDVISKYKDAVDDNFDGIKIELPFSVASKVRDMAIKNNEFVVRRENSTVMKENNCDIYSIIDIS